MGKILISFAQPFIGNNENNIIAYYESVAKELNKKGNQVFLFNNYNLQKLNAKTDKNTIIKIKKYNPNLIIAFNNQIPEELIQNTDCPIALFDADSVNLFANLNFIKKYNSRYFMVSFWNGWYDKYSELGFSKNRICTINPATSIKNENISKDKNISFIGSNFYSFNNKIVKYINNNSQAIYKVLKDFWAENDFNYKKYIDRYCEDADFSIYDLYDMFDSRKFILSSILDLGLSLYGTGWERDAIYNYALASAFDKTPKYSLKDNQDIYNSSKICLSISHPQCNGYAFPWRIYDIMASNGLLISSYSELLKKQTKGYVDIPMYKSPYEARDLCKKYLNEPNLCEDIIAASNEFIEKYGRWDDNFKNIEELTGVHICNENKEGNNSTYEIIKYIPKDIKNKVNFKNRIRLKLYNRLKKTLSRKRLIKD